MRRMYEGKAWLLYEKSDGEREREREEERVIRNVFFKISMIWL